MNKSRILQGLGAILGMYAGASNAADWICAEAASIKEGDSYLVCGVATADNEGDAREQALLRAQKEFDLFCKGSQSCRGRPTSVEPLRNSCENTAEGKIKCYRGLRYSFMDDDAGLFGRSAPVGDASNSRPDTIKPFNFGVAYYQQTYNVSGADPANAATPLLTDNYGGVSVYFSTAFNHRYGVNLNGYFLNNTNSTQQSKLGVDAQFIIGTHLNQRGLKALAGVGGFGEKWKNGGVSQDFYGALFAFGLGYNFRSTTLDFLVNIRQTRTYDNYLMGGDLTGKKSTASGALFRIGLRF